MACFGRALTLALTLAAVSQLAWVRPELPVKAAAAQPDQRLAYLVVLVNGEPHLVHAGEELPVLRGDLIEISEARLASSASHSADAPGPESPGSSVPSTPSVPAVRVYGLARRAHTADDLHQSFRTHQLKERYSEDKKGTVYAVVVTSTPSGSTEPSVSGVVYLHLLDPVLRYVEISLNGVNQLLRDQDNLSVHKADKVKVVKVVTSLASSAEVAVQLRPTGLPGRYAFEFSRDGRVFARVALQVAD